MRAAVALLALTLGGCAVLDWARREAEPPTPSNCEQIPCPDGFECNKHGQCVPQPSPEATAIPASPIPTIAPPPSPVPSPDPPLPSPVPPCAEVPCAKPAGCVSCAAYMSDAIRSGELIREGALVYNIGNAGKEYFDPQTCNTVWPDGSLRNRRLHKDGTICPECPKPVCPSPKPPSPSPSVPPSSDRYCSLEPGARNWPLMPGSDKLPSEGGVCPSCWGDHPELIVTNCGIRLKAVQCRGGQPECPGRRYVFDATCHSDAPRCPHRPDQRSCDVLWGCQPPAPAFFQTFGDRWELAPVVPVSHNPYLAQINISDPVENGWYTLYVCPPGLRPDGPDGPERCGSLYLYVGTDGTLSE